VKSVFYHNQMVYDDLCFTTKRRLFFKTFFHKLFDTTYFFVPLIKHYPFFSRLHHFLLQTANYYAFKRSHIAMHTRLTIIKTQFLL